MFKERNTKLTMLSLLSAVVVISTAFVGISIYAQTDYSDLTTIEEEELKDEEEITAQAASDSSDNETTSTAESETILAEEVSALLDGLIACDLGVMEINAATNETEVAAFADTTPTVSVTLMTETEVAELASNSTETSSANETEIAAASNETSTASINETQTASAGCIQIGVGNATSTAESNTTATATAETNITSASNNATLTSNASSTSSANATSTASTTEPDRDILVIEGEDFAPGEVVLMFSDNALVGIDLVDDQGGAESKVPVSEVPSELKFVESGTIRSASFNFDGETLVAAEGFGEIQAAGAEDTLTASNATSTMNSTSTMQ